MFSVQNDVSSCERVTTLTVRSCLTLTFVFLCISSPSLVANGVYQNSVYGVAACLPMKYTNAVVLGSVSVKMPSSGTFKLSNKDIYLLGTPGIRVYSLRRCPFLFLTDYIVNILVTLVTHKYQKKILLISGIQVRPGSVIGINFSQCLLTTKIWSVNAHGASMCNTSFILNLTVQSLDMNCQLVLFKVIVKMTV